MKLPLKIKLLSLLRKRIEKVTEGQKVPKWIIFAVKLIGLPAKLKSSHAIQLVINLNFVFCTSKSQARVFTGWGYRWLSVKYADKRSDISKVNKLCGGKRHYVIEYDKQALIVLNKIEMNTMKAKHMLRKSYNTLDVFKNAFYVTAR